MLTMIAMATRYPVEKPHALGEARYYTSVIGKNHGYRQMLLDESGRAESPEYCTDYRSWYWSQARNLYPPELNDLASQSAFGPRLSKGRSRIVAQLAPLGDAFVKNGKLIPRPQDTPVSPNFPEWKG